ncbi:MAG: saccharopine dehydrogenase NADP-binding domain-containing protein [Gemmatimonadetes bacterium]|nr:saccharopine dehydrogenase NADP-binding domain-containing protein [Gemmatimonadota bacterium]
MRMLVLGAGLQGSACAFDLLQRPEVSEVVLADKALDHLPPFLAPYLGGRLKTLALDVRDQAAVLAAMRGAAAVMSAIPYYFNLDLARAAVEAGVHFSDLGGNTEIVFQQKKLHEEAKRKGLSIMPDCGVAPGMVNILAQQGIEAMETVDAVRIFVGGLPQHPEPPLNYQIVYSLEGVLDYYTTLSWVLRGGKRTQVTALSERVSVDFPAPVGTLEAFHTAGGLSTMAFRYEGKIPVMEYKTLRYPGHAAIMEAMRTLGLLDLEAVTTKDGTQVAPRDVFVATVGPRLTKPNSPDLVALRVVVEGKKNGVKAAWARELIDRHDATHGVSAMMRCTGYSLAITGLFQATKQVTAHGVTTPDEAMPAEAYVAALAERGVKIQELAGATV